MGTLSQLRARGRGPRPHSNGSDGGPLRRVVESGHNTAGQRIETYECGHVCEAKRDLMGYTNAVRRRCWQCKKQEQTK